MEDLEKKQYYYYYAMYGPGHQGCDDGFIDLPSYYDNEDIADHLFGIINKDNCSVLFWKVDSLPSNIIKEKEKDFKAEINRLKKKLERLKQMKSVVVSQEKGHDEKISELLKERPDYYVIEELHKKKIFVTREDINNWTWPPDSIYSRNRDNMKPSKSIRRKVINAIKRAKKWNN